MATTNVLVVEDERIVALHLRQQLQKFNYNVTSLTSSYEQALAMIREVLPDVVLMDIHIEGDKDGIEAAALIGTEFKIPIIFLTAYSDEATLRRARASKPFGYLLKPFSDRELHATIQMVLERYAVQLDLEESEERLGLALTAAQMRCWEIEPVTRTILSTCGRGDFHPADVSEVLAGSWNDFIQQVHQDDQALVEETFSRILIDNSLGQVEFRSRRADGCMRWLRVQGKAFPSAVDRGKRIIGVVQDVTERRGAEDQLRQAATVFENTQDGIAILDRNFLPFSINQSLCRMTGYSPDELMGQTLCLASPGTHQHDMRPEILSSLGHQGQWRGEVIGRRKDGTDFPILLNVTGVRSDRGDFAHYVVVFADLTSIRKAEQDLTHLAHYDPLTELPNRVLAIDRLDHAVERGLRERHKVGLMFVDLDHFKDVNDTLGHSVGDDLLRMVAKRMRMAVRQQDTVARLGGDEFMVIIDRVDNQEDVAKIATKIIAAIALPVTVGGMDLRVTASIGIGIYPDDGESGETIIRAADTAMYVAKEQGRDRYAFYTRRMTAEASHYLTLSQELTRGIELGELSLYFQPQVSLQSGNMVGLEALLRWERQGKRILGAGEIIPIAEKSGLILSIGEWVVRRACEQVRDWRAIGLEPVRVAINVSPYQMRGDRLLRAVTLALADTAIDPRAIEVEITESMLQSGLDCVATLRALEAMGVTLAIDDFGTGYSCLSSLKTMPIHRLKIDRSFVQDTPDEHNNVVIVETIIAMAHKLGLSVIAEGVETVAQEQFLRAAGCEEAQGFLHGKPMPVDEITQVMAAWHDSSSLH
jgi:diguanylate cyclase (GGDEF)-like protein/PAS domain S-box-containing protein